MKEVAKANIKPKAQKQTGRRKPKKWCQIKYHPCCVCGKSIANPERKTCSNECRDSKRSQNGTLKRRIVYDNRYIFQSKWEVEIAKFLDDKKISWEQPSKRIRWFDSTLNKQRTYLPDFYLPDFYLFLDVKNPFKQEQDQDKIRQLKKVIHLVVKDLNEMKIFIDNIQTGVPDRGRTYM